jgi:hypothetical protein
MKQRLAKIAPEGESGFDFGRKRVSIHSLNSFKTIAKPRCNPEDYCFLTVKANRIGNLDLSLRAERRREMRVQ